MDLTLQGKITVFSLVHPENVCAAIVVMFFGRITDWREEQSMKQPKSRVFILGGRLTFFSDKQPIKQ